jgi:hypothetical protein
LMAGALKNPQLTIAVLTKCTKTKSLRGTRSPRVSVRCRSAPQQGAFNSAFDFDHETPENSHFAAMKRVRAVDRNQCTTDIGP